MLSRSVNHITWILEPRCYSTRKIFIRAGLGLADCQNNLGTLRFLFSLTSIAAKDGNTDRLPSVFSIRKWREPTGSRTRSSGQPGTLDPPKVLRTWRTAGQCSRNPTTWFCSIQIFRLSLLLLFHELNLSIISDLTLEESFKQRQQLSFTDPKKKNCPMVLSLGSFFLAFHLRWLEPNWLRSKSSIGSSAKTHHRAHMHSRTGPTDATSSCKWNYFMPLTSHHEVSWATWTEIECEVFSKL